MKKLISILLIIFSLMLGISSILTIGCEKEPTYNKYIGEWVSEQDNINFKGNNTIYSGFYNDTTTNARKILLTSSLNIILTDAPYKVINAWVVNNKLIFADFMYESGPRSNCSDLKIYYFDVKAEIINDTLIETGKYSVYVDSLEVSEI